MVNLVNTFYLLSIVFIIMETYVFFYPKILVVNSTLFNYLQIAYALWTITGCCSNNAPAFGILCSLGFITGLIKYKVNKRYYVTIIKSDSIVSILLLITILLKHFLYL
jgi:hypothetical protein